VRTEEFQFCPKCGAALHQWVSATPESSPGTITCAACGATFQASDIASTAAVPVPAPSGRNPFALVVVALVAAGMIFFGFHMARRAQPGGTPRITKSAEAPDFTLESLDGKNTKLSDFRGKAVLLNFWATWCGPCKIEMPWFVELQNEYGSQGLQIVGVAMDDSGKDDIAKFVKEMGVNYPVLLGKEAVGDQYGGVPALPESFFISRDGKITDKFIGLRGKAEVEDAIKKALSTPAGASQTAASTAVSTVQAQK
jgi:thiol-disulfide isomerase/thioredoxin